MNNLLPEAEKILTIINKFGCTTFEQICAIVENPKKEESLSQEEKLDTQTKWEEKLRRTIGWLSAKQYIKVSENGIITQKQTDTFSKRTLESLWVIIDCLTYDNHFDYETFIATQTYSPGEKLIASFVHKTQKIINLAYVSKNDIMDVPFLQQRYYTFNHVKPGKEKESKFAYFFVTKDKSVVEEIYNMKKNGTLKMVFVVVLLTENGMKKPSIKYI